MFAARQHLHCPTALHFPGAPPTRAQRRRTFGGTEEHSVVARILLAEPSEYEGVRRRLVGGAGRGACCGARIGAYGAEVTGARRRATPFADTLATHRIMA